MGRIVVNKHYDISSGITADKFSSEYFQGEIIISNEKDNEGLFIMNSEGEVVNVSAAKSEKIMGDVLTIISAMAETIQTMQGTIEGLEETVRALQSGSTQDETPHIFLTLGEYQELLSSGSVVVCGETITFDELSLYCIVNKTDEEDVPQEESAETITVSVSGTSMAIEGNSVVYSAGTLSLMGEVVNGVLTIADSVPKTPSTPAEDDEPSDEPDGNVEGTILSLSGEVDENGTLTITSENITIE